MHGCLFPIHRFVHISSVNQKLWPPEVYQACSTEVRSGTANCVCDAYVSVSGSGCGKAENDSVPFSLSSTQLNDQTLRFENFQAMTSNLQAQIYMYMYIVNCLQ